MILVPDLSLFLEKALYEVKGGGLQLSFNAYRYMPQLDIQ